VVAAAVAVAVVVVVAVEEEEEELGNLLGACYTIPQGYCDL